VRPLARLCGPGSTVTAGGGGRYLKDEYERYFDQSLLHYTLDIYSMRSDPSQYLPESTRQVFSDYGSFPPPPDANRLHAEVEYDEIDIVEERVGRGGFAVVHHGRVDGCDVALKEPRADSNAPPETFVAEAEFWQGLTGEKSPPFLVDCYAWGTDPHPWICTEFLPRGTLYRYLEEYVESKGRWLPLDTALWMATVLARAVEYAHSQGLTHRDLKPDNILLKEVEGFDSLSTDLRLGARDRASAR